MDGLLINSEDITTSYTNALLAKYDRPPMTWSVRAQLMGVPGATNGDVFHSWAQLPITRAQWAAELNEAQAKYFPHCQIMPGAEELLNNLKKAGVKLALASSTQTKNYELKISNPEIKRLLSIFPTECKIVGHDPRVRQGRGKPAPDIYLAALNAINSTVDIPITPKECLVFEDAVAGVEAGRRAGMRVVWVPHPDVALEYQARERQVLAGRTGMIGLGDEWQLGELDDEMAERITTLTLFNYEHYGIRLTS